MNRKRITQSEWDYIYGHWDSQRKETRKAIEANRRAKDRLKALQEYCARESYTEFQTREKIKEDWDFIDALDDRKEAWEKAKMHANIVQSEFAARAMLDMIREDGGDVE